MTVVPIANLEMKFHLRIRWVILLNIILLLIVVGAQHPLFFISVSSIIDYSSSVDKRDLGDVFGSVYLNTTK